MSYSLMPLTGSGLPSRVERQAAREVVRIQAAGLVAAARQVEKVEVIEAVTQAAMLATSRLAQLEGLLAAQTPHAAGRLQFLAEAAAMGMGSVVQQTVRQVT